MKLTSVVKSAARRLRWFSPTGSILCFHGLSSPDLPSAAQANIPIELFRSLMDAIHDTSQVIPLGELLERRRRGRRNDGLIALTFDDAYHSLHLALPILAERGDPITVFVTDFGASGGAAYWWDRIDDVAARIHPSQFAEFEQRIGLPLEYKTGQRAEFGPLRPLRQWILSAHNGRWPAALERSLAELEASAGTQTVQRSMTYQELEQLVESEWITLGVHTLSHPVLPLLPDTEIRAEVGRCLQALRDRYVGVEPILAFPFGLYDARTVEIARAEGITGCLALGSRTLGNLAGGVGYRFCLTSREKEWKLLARLTGLPDLAWWRREPQPPTLPSATA